MIIDKDMYDGVIMKDEKGNFSPEFVYKIVGEMTLDKKDYLLIEHLPEYAGKEEN